MPHQQQEQQEYEPCLEDVRDLFVQRETLKHKINEEKVKNKEIIERLSQMRKDRESEKYKNDSIKERIECHKQKQAMQQLQITKAELDLAGTNRLVESYGKIDNEKNHMNDLFSNVELKRGEQLLQCFKHTYSQIPWILERNKLQKQLDYEEDRLTNIYERISETDRNIAGIQATLARHEERPFNKVCIVIGEYKRKSSQLDKLIKRELKAREEHCQKMNICKRQRNILLQETLNSTSSEFPENVTKQFTSGKQKQPNIFTSYNNPRPTKVRFGGVRMKSVSPSADEENMSTSEPCVFSAKRRFMSSMDEHNSSQDEFGESLELQQYRQHHYMRQEESEIQQVIRGNSDEMNSFNINFDDIGNTEFPSFNLPLSGANNSLSDILSFNFSASNGFM